ncbi:MAG: Smr/MutS family protein [Pseudomonadota bacterium]
MDDEYDQDNDDRLWAFYTKGIKPIGPRTPKPVKRVRPAVTIRPIIAAPTVLSVGPAPRSEMRATDDQTLRKLKRGTWTVAAEIDLHGMTQTQAHSALIHFMGNALAQDHKCVRIITGKGGRHGPDKPGILKQKVPQWLQDSPLAPWIVSLHHPPAHQGGVGALIVLLRKSRATTS